VLGLPACHPTQMNVSVVVKDWLLEDKDQDLRSEDEDKDSNFKLPVK